MATVHPIDSLPDELIVAIFVYCVQLDRPGLSVDPRDPPWLLGQVCSRWRRIALDTPTLWPNIRLRFHRLEDIADELEGKKDDPDVISEFEFCLAAFIELLRHQLARSKEQPLKMWADLTDVEWETHTEALEELVDIISPHSHRIQELDIEYDSALNRVMESSATPWDLTALRQLKLNFHDHPSEEPTEEQQSYPLFRSAAALSSARLTNYIPSPSDMQWSQIEELIIDSPDSAAMYAILSSLTKVRSLRLNFNDEDEDFSQEPVLLPSLTDLHTESVTILRLITAPKLQRFKPPLWLANDIDVQIIIMFIQRSECALDGIWIQSSGVHAAAIIRLLDVTPDLRQLTWSQGGQEPFLFKELMRALTTKDGRGLFRLCPRLEQAHFDLLTDNPRSVTDMMERRWDAGQGLRKVEFRFSDMLWFGELENDDDISQRVKRLKAEGMDITAKYNVMYPGKPVEIW